jgi:PqqD family protein of HPr-rel-A system
MTHVVAPPAPQIIEAIAADPADAATILARIGKIFELESDQDPLDALQARLDELEAAGLVSRL